MKKQQPKMVLFPRL